MATVPSMNAFTNGTTISSVDVNENFDNLAAFAQDETVHKDGSVAFTGLVSGPATNPSGDNHLTRKAYVDARTPLLLAKKQQWSVTDYASNGTTWDDFGTSGADYGPASFTWPTLVANQCVEVQVHIPELHMNTDGGYPIEGMTLEVGLFKKVGSDAYTLEQIAKTLVGPTAALGLDLVTSVSMCRHYYGANTAVSGEPTRPVAGDTVQFKLMGRLVSYTGGDNQGMFNLQGSDNCPIEIIVRRV